MEVTLNGETISINQTHNLTEFIAQLDLNGKFAIELNQNIIPRSEYSNTWINAGDTIEIVQAIGGG